eukprot:comp8041_c0_seq1/m.3546 comp8041_c0_seq1/g.3546  ORF comp8041_c0_seq1/g.3546 comp8041_c0_seq1/m.3546 type:complete len:154 (-) comp8041_c0_seq1:357-818(-)
MASPPTTKSNDLIFAVSNYAILPAWGLLAAAPTWGYTMPIVRAAQLYNSAAYVYCLGNAMTSNDGAKIAFKDMMSFKGIRRLLALGGEKTHLAAWIHYLAFDLVVGEFIVKDAMQVGIPAIVRAPVLFFTCMLGPSGFLLYAGVRLFYTSKLF